MTSPANTYLPPAPQIGREAVVADTFEPTSGLWPQLLARFRDLGGTFDPFANDANAEIRRLGRAARHRKQPQANDYFTIGDMCARLTLQENILNSTYAVKTIVAYSRAAEVAPIEERPARKALISFANWVVEIARLLDDFSSLEVAAMVCSRVRQADLLASHKNDVERLAKLEAQIHEQLARITDVDTGATDSAQATAERESRLLCDQGQILLRQAKVSEALSVFDRALELNNQNHSAWLWRAMALTDSGRFDEALESYDRALALAPTSASVWNSKGALLMELGRLEPALACFEQALAISSTPSALHATFLLNKGKALFMLQRYEAARDALVRSHQLDPSPETAAGIAACREHLGETA